MNDLIPPINHVLFIPFVLALGFFLGWNLGTRSVRHEWDRAEKRRRDRDEAG